MSVFISKVTLNVGVWGYTVQLFSGSTGLHKPIEVGSKGQGKTGGTDYPTA